MATISTSQTFDSAARTAGEAFTINSGAVFTINSDTRDGKNAAASRAGSMSSFTMTSATGGQVVIDGTQVWIIAYDGLIGSPNVPALGTTIRGVTSGATGELMNCTSAISSTPTAAGAAMPATGWFKLKSKSGTFQDNETLEISGSTDLCLANGIGQRGWIEVVMDDAATWTIGRAQNLTINGDWFVSATTGSGSAHQQVQFPNYGGANFFLPGVWVDEAANDNWEFWPACITGTGTFWSAANMLAETKNKFCECLGGGLFIPPYFFLLNGWRVRPMEASHNLTITGNLFVDGGGVPVVSTLGTYQVNVNYTVPVQAQGIATSGSTGPTAGEIAAAILAAAQITPIYSDIRKVNNLAVDGTGTESDPWGPSA